MKNHPNSKMIEGMEALRSIAATSMFLQNEKCGTANGGDATKMSSAQRKQGPFLFILIKQSFCNENHSNNFRFSGSTN